MIGFHLGGTVREAESGIGIRGLFVKAYDKDLLFDDLLGSTFTGDDGELEIVAEAADFRDFFERRPDIYLKIYAPDRRTLLASTKNAVRWNAGRYETFDVRIPREDLGAHAPRRGMTLVGEDGAARTSVQTGEPLTLQVHGLRPSTPHRLTVSDDQGELFTDVLVSNARGTIVPTVVWPLFGIEDPRAGGPQRVEDAHERWRGRRIHLRLGEGRTVVAETTVHAEAELSRPLAISTDGKGFVLNGFEAGEHDARVSLYAFHDAEEVRVFLVERQHDWRHDDAIRPVAFADTTIERGRAEVTLARAGEIRPGAYDFIVRRMRYGYEDDEAVLRADDVVTRRVTGLVVREKFMPSKVILGGCANVQPIAGRVLPGAPYFQYADVFQVGEDIYGALDPAALDPNTTGKMVAAYVVPHKDAAGWSDPGLQHALGGNANTQRWLTQSSCINANIRLLWPAASKAGEYDVVADFGNNTADPTAFDPDDEYDMPLDIIDGYIQPGFRVVPDPGVETSFPFAGSFEYDESTQGTRTIADKHGEEVVPMRAIVHFPADVPGAASIAQTSMAQLTYPLVVVLHGNTTLTETSFRGYNYLLEHLAKNGFIAASVHQSINLDIRGRARVLREHLGILFGLFAGRVGNNVGILGHSRGGEAAFQAAGLNTAEGWGYGINAVVSLTPTAYDNWTYLHPWSAPCLVVAGSLDEQLSTSSDVGFELYDHAAPPKSLAYVYGGGHARYNTEWVQGPEGYWNIHPLDAARMIGTSAHHAIALGYITPFFRMHLRSESQWAGIFKGEWIPSSVQSSSPKLRICMQYEDATVRTIDDFEGAHTPTSWETSTIGGTVTRSGLASTPQEDLLAEIVPGSPHATAGLRAAWDPSGGALQWAVPAGQRDVSGFAALSLRIGQVIETAANPLGQAQDLRVTLTDGGGNSRSIRTSKFGELPYPEVQQYAGNMMSQMRTIRIPLHAYTIRCLGMAAVDLTDVVAVRFDFIETPTGDVSIDSIQFTS